MLQHLSLSAGRFVASSDSDAANGIFIVESIDGELFHVAFSDCHRSQRRTREPIPKRMVVPYLKRLGLTEPQDAEWLREGDARPVHRPTPRVFKEDEAAGYVYALTNKFIPGLVKIGKAANLVSRMRALALPTGVPGRFECLVSVVVADRHSRERDLHLRFADRRINLHREFFAVGEQEVLDEFRRIESENADSTSVLRAVS